MINKHLILYGAGDYGKKNVLQCKKLDIHIECMCDADPKKKGLSVEGVPVKSIEEVKSQYKKGEYFIIVSMAPNNAAIVKNELISKGIFEPTDFYDPDSSEEMIVSLATRKAYNKPEEENRDVCISATKNNFILLSKEQEDALESLIKSMYGTGGYLDTEAGMNDYRLQLHYKLEHYRRELIPWLESIRPLENTKILEIGCGTGQGTVAFCEQGADVHAIDCSVRDIEITRNRLQIYGLYAELKEMNAADIAKAEFQKGNFDFIIYSAALEHMTYAERLKTIKASYDLIRDNQYIVLCAAPNRLWHTDTHHLTIREPFYYWLPDDLAIDYAKYTKKAYAYDEDREKNVEKLHRWAARGVSYHEFEVAIGRGNLRIASVMEDFHGISIADELYKMCLKMQGPDHIDDGFYNEFLNIALEKSK